MVRYAGLKRHRDGLQKGLEELSRQRSIFDTVLEERAEFEFANMLTCALLTTTSALYREESRGGHYRVDFPQRDDDNWSKHTIMNRNQGQLEGWIQHV